MSVRILNTWGGYTAKDATALPGDVKEGKIFYNKEGRKIGEGKFTQEKSIIPVNNIDPLLYSYSLKSTDNCKYFDVNIGSVVAASETQHTIVPCNGTDYYLTKHSGTITSIIGIMDEDLLYIHHVRINGIDYIMSIPIETVNHTWFLFHFCSGRSSYDEEDIMFSVGYDKWGYIIDGVKGLFVDNPHNYNIELFLTVGEILSN